MKDSLTQYRRKRDFTKTPEPEGKTEKRKNERRFVIQFHFARKDHYDFRLEWNGVLLSWAIPKGPSMNPSDKRLAVQTEDHPLSYRDFEGNIPIGQYGGGTVMLFDEGLWEPLNPVKNGLKEGNLKFILRGERIRGAFALIRMKDENWLLIKEKDAYAKKTAGIQKFKTSIRSGQTMEEIKKGRQQKTSGVKPNAELALLREEIPSESGWIYEIKYDGYRILSIVEDGNVRLLSRNHIDYSDKFETISQALKALSSGRSMILDGEIVVSDHRGKSDFQALQSAIRKKNTDLASYVIFDLLSLDGNDLRSLPLIQRKRKLAALLKNRKGPLLFSAHTEGNGKELFQKAQESSLEGIIGKKKDSPYTGTRSGNWIKLKCRKSDEFLIAGYIPSEAKEKKIRSLLLGSYEGENLCYKGKVGSGLTHEKEKELLRMFHGKERKTSAFSKNEKMPLNSIYLRPELIAEVEYAEITADGLLRQASFKGIRLDKTIEELKDEFIISNPDRIVYPEKKITKSDIAHYYRNISEEMLPYLLGRPLSVLRCNKDIYQGFIKKHPVKKVRGISTFLIPGNDASKKMYFSISSEEGILSEVQSGTVEFHIWGSKKEHLEHPDYMVFDLDPDEGMPLSKIRRGVMDLKQILDECGLVSFLKTSGGKGYHIVVPFLKSGNWESFSDFAFKIAKIMEERWPNAYTTNIRKKNRKGKIFIDWLRNKRGATSVAPYSLRARKKAGISMPIAWSELNKIAPDDITIETALKRKGKDPWKDFFDVAKKQKFR